MDHRPGGHAQFLHAAQRLREVFINQLIIRGAQFDAGGFRRLDFVDDAIIGILERHRHQLAEAIAGFGNHIDGCFDAALLRIVQKARHFASIFGIILIQRVQQQDIADVQNVAVQLIPVDIIFIEFSVRAQIGKEGAFLGNHIAHHQRKGGNALADHVIQIDILIFAQLLQNQFALGVLADFAHGVQRHIRIQLRQIDNGVAHRAAGRALDAVQHVYQLPLIRPTVGGIENINDHISRYANALSHNFTPVHTMFVNSIISQTNSIFNTYTPFSS